MRLLQETDRDWDSSTQSYRSGREPSVPRYSGAAATESQEKTPRPDLSRVESYSYVEVSTSETSPSSLSLVESYGSELPQPVTDSLLGVLPELSTSEWDGGVVEKDELAAWDDDPRLRTYVAARLGYVPGESLTGQYVRGVTGDDSRLRTPEYVTWKRRLLIESGLISVSTIKLAPLPTEATNGARDLWSKIELLLQARALGGSHPSQPLPLADRLLAGRR